MTNGTSGPEELAVPDSRSRPIVRVRQLVARAIAASLFACAGLTLGCHGRSPSGPSQPGSGQPTTSASLTVSAVAPNTGTAEGATVVTISGTGFQSGATVTLGGPATTVTVHNSTTIVASTSAHPAGTVDVVVANPDGRRAVLMGAFTYAAAPPVPAPVVTAISPEIGSTGGGVPVVVTGTGFRETGYHSGVILTIGDAVITPYYANSTTIWAQIPAHIAARVDVIVTNSDGQTGRLAGGYTFAPPQSFDFNGAWEGDDHDGPAIRFMIQNDALTSLACGTSTPVTFSHRVPVTNGEFSFSSDDGVAVSGRILSPSTARGTITMAPCAGTWFAEKQQAAH